MKQMDTSFSDRKYMSFQDYRIQNWVSRHSISPEMYSSKYSVCVCVCLQHRGNLLEGEKEKKKILKRHTQLNLRLKPSTSEKQTADFSSPQLNWNMQGELKKMILLYPHAEDKQNFQVQRVWNWKCCMILGSLTCLKIPKILACKDKSLSGPFTGTITIAFLPIKL